MTRSVFSLNRRGKILLAKLSKRKSLNQAGFLISWSYLFILPHAGSIFPSGRASWAGPLRCRAWGCSKLQRYGCRWRRMRRRIRRLSFCEISLHTCRLRMCVGLLKTFLSEVWKMTVREWGKSRTMIFEITHRDFLNHAPWFFRLFGVFFYVTNRGVCTVAKKPKINKIPLVGFVLCNHSSFCSPALCFACMSFLLPAKGVGKRLEMVWWGSMKSAKIPYTWCSQYAMGVSTFVDKNAYLYNYF